MEIKEVFEKYKHLDHLFSDKDWLYDDFKGSIIFDMWKAIKEAHSEDSVYHHNVCNTCGEPMSGDCLRCQRLWQS